MACYTQEEIAERENTPQQTVVNCIWPSSFGLMNPERKRERYEKLHKENTGKHLEALIEHEIRQWLDAGLTGEQIRASGS